MRITLVTIGSHGDIRPVAALAAGLAAAGHEPVLVADRSAAPLVEGRGVELRPFSADVRALSSGREAAELFERGTNPRALTRAMARLGREHALDGARESLEAARGSDAVFGAGLGVYTAVSLSEKLGIPLVVGGLQPLGPTGDFPPPLIPPPKLRLPRFVNKALHMALMQLVWLGFRKDVNRARREVLGLRPWSPVGPAAYMLRRKVNGLYGVSPSLVPRPEDWPETLHMTGAWFLDEPRWTPPEDLRAFMAAGPPPVYVGFGSMGGYDPAATTRLVVEALDGRRAVLASGWGGLERADLPSTVHGLESAPHDWLFPRMAAVAHHGGAGTTHAAARAGVPSVVVPFLADQPFWGRRLRDLGVAPEPIPRARLTASALRSALQATSGAAMRGAAEELGERVRAERGIETAVELIEREVRRQASVGPASGT